MANLNPSADELSAQTTERDEVSRRLVESDARLRVVVAGPGTGKTFCFRGALEKAGGGLALTFINNLVDLMRDDLGDVAEAYTCHGYAKLLFFELGAPGFSGGVDYYVPLHELLTSDLRVLRGEALTQEDLERRFTEVDTSDGVLHHALHLAEHYRAVTHSDCVVRVTDYLRAHPDDTPTVPLLVVDEFQDFNRSEARFLWLLGLSNRMLVAGDDDQALYSFKGASSKFLRLIHSRDESECHCLPYCSRCPAAVTECVSQVVQRAQAEGRLAGRLPKRFECYLPEKLADSRDYPRVRHVACTVETKKSPYVGRAVGELIGRIPDEDWETARDGGHPCVLVVGPMEFVRRAHSTLGDEGLVAALKQSSPLEVGLSDGYFRLAADAGSRLGWRIVVYCRPPEDWEKYVKVATTGDCSLSDLLPADYVAEHLEAADAIASAVMGQPVDGAVSERVRVTAGLSLEALVATADEVSFGAGDSTGDSGAGYAGGILCTSFAGCKGLSAHHVFVVGMNDGHFPKARNAITDDEVCQLLVALSRTKKSCTLVSTGRFGMETPAPSVFLEWLSPVLESYCYSKKGLEPDPVS